MTQAEQTNTAQAEGLSPIQQAKLVYAHFLQNTGLWLLLAAVAFMFTPTLIGLFEHNIWTDDEHAHGPLILSISLWLLWTRWHEALPQMAIRKSAPMLAWACFLVAAALYIPGRALSIIYFETSAVIWALAGVVLLEGGTKLLGKVWFPLLFMVFMVPLPNTLVMPISNTLKTLVSIATVDILNWAGYPIARTGVIITIGQYQLLVADACAGMRTLFMLEALGILYLNLVKHTSTLRNIVLPILIVPISFIANVTRVIVLALITYHLGDEAGQGFLHGFSGMVLFMVGLIITLAVDSGLRFMSHWMQRHGK